MSLPNITPQLTEWNTPIFNGHPDEDVLQWLSSIKEELQQRHVPSMIWVDVAFQFLGEEPRQVMDGVKRKMADIEAGRGGWDWDWKKFSRTLVYIHERVKRDAAENHSGNNSVAEDVRRFRTEHPYASAAAGLGLIVVGGITVAPAILVGTLNVLGFGAGGVAAASIAAGVQSAVYGGAVGAGSLFAMAQSAAAGGVVVAPVVLQAVSAGAVVVGAWLGFGRQAENRPHSPSDEV
ncbi:hypothetical protein C8R43DRAFT_994202 [Mycena crocata]|nr:hypothetical protein C8R43DRAFT_994202 [Mycena crocata]